MADWTDLPMDILVVIAQCLTVIEDFTSFTAVCKSWQSVTSILKKKPSLPTRYPRIMLAEKIDTEDQQNRDDQDASIRCFLNLLTSKTYQLQLPEARGRKCTGAHYGWLWTIGIDLQINLLHPFSRQQICLPPMLTLPDQYVYDERFMPQEVWGVFVAKIVMSSNPLKDKCLHDYNEDCTIVAIYGEYAILVFTKLGDTVWTNISVQSRVYQDIIFYNGKFYAVDVHGVVVVCDFDDANGPKAIVIAPAPIETNDTYQKYLVESSGHLLLVARFRKGISLNFDDDVDDEEEGDDNEEDMGDVDGNVNVDEVEDVKDCGNEEEKEAGYYTTGFFVWRLDECHEEGSNYAYRLTQVTSLGDQALFLGSNVSTSVASSESIKPNCIYFTDDNYELYFEEPGGGGHDTGIFNMEDKTTQLNYAGESRSNISPPLWYI
ncbi:putative F-box protein At5g55150 [Olea europaea var. sylvestris]|uniref:putative F-box protein At5g55150 n=1 Tax=Olea europaea var. sylvestris TaxID=158386 RepID=UPI000C1D0768|nr:putative F-box protein At5g55150 [Olea europaea var. sylvestris]XP_022890269.1 putative F-box protein At5g55150 [Olea europaea var. sylvestris]